MLASASTSSRILRWNIQIKRSWCALISIIRLSLFSFTVFSDIYFFPSFFHSSGVGGGKRRKREGEKHPSHRPSTGEHLWAASRRPPHPGMCPDWESSWQPFSLQDTTRPTALCQSQLFFSTSCHQSLQPYPHPSSPVSLLFASLRSLALFIYLFLVSLFILPPLWQPSPCSLYLWVYLCFVYSSILFL